MYEKTVCFPNSPLVSGEKKKTNKKNISPIPKRAASALPRLGRGHLHQDCLGESGRVRVRSLCPQVPRSVTVSGEVRNTLHLGLGLAALSPALKLSDKKRSFAEKADEK